MTQSEIVTQHFNDPIGSVINVDGKCYVKVSNKTDVINTPVPTDEYSVYFENTDDCENNRVENSKLLCPPVGKLLFTVGEANATAILCFDIPSMRTRPTQIKYVEKPFSMTRTLTQATLIHDDQPTLPTSATDASGNERKKIAVSRLKTSVVMYGDDQPLDNMINKMVHNT